MNANRNSGKIIIELYIQKYPNTYITQIIPSQMLIYSIGSNLQCLHHKLCGWNKNKIQLGEENLKQHRYLIETCHWWTESDVLIRTLVRESCRENTSSINLHT